MICSFHIFYAIKKYGVWAFARWGLRNFTQKQSCELNIWKTAWATILAVMVAKHIARVYDLNVARSSFRLNCCLHYQTTVHLLCEPECKCISYETNLEMIVLYQKLKITWSWLPIWSGYLYGAEHMFSYYMKMTSSSSTTQIDCLHRSDITENLRLSISIRNR